jgi:hypothetical protein
MSTLTTKRFRAAIRETVITVKGCAAESGYSGISWDTYLNRRAPSRAAALALADALEKRAERLATHARRLREAASDEAGGADDPVRAPGG